MNNTFNSQPLSKEASEITVDWSDALQEEHPEISHMLQWIRTYPNQKGVHVYLGKGRHKPAGRRLQNALQAMGCIVTNKCLLTA